MTTDGDFTRSAPGNEPGGPPPGEHRGAGSAPAADERHTVHAGRPTRGLTLGTYGLPIGASWVHAGRPARGFTLVELMVVLVVIGILGAIAIPTYRQYTFRAWRTEAVSALLQLAANQERHYLQRNTYTDDLAALGFAAGVSGNGIYTLSVPVADAAAYEAVAVPTPGGGSNGVSMSGDAECARFTIDALGRRRAFPDPNGACW